jgi:NAD(P)-dependent dehydrogenase (short-subunit alcohol dehydrogenase family)
MFVNFLNLPPAQVDPAKSIYDESLGRAPARGRLQGRKVIVVGAGQRKRPEPDPPFGNGRAIAHLFAREGARVGCVDLSAEAVDYAVGEMRAEGLDVFGEVADVGDADAIAPLVARCIDRLGGFDGLVANVGITSGVPFADLTADVWDHDFNVNARSHMLLSQQALARMTDGGSMLLVSSTGALFPGARQPAYEASKAALLALTRSVAKAGEPRGIRCNCVLPGLMDTPMGRDEARRRPERGSQVPFGRQGTAWEIAYAALFLISHEASYVNAHSMVVDGGQVFGIVRGAGAT